MKNPALVLFCLGVFSLTASSQTTVTTNGGTAGTVPLFSDTASIGNSLMTQTNTELPGNTQVNTPSILTNGRLYITTPGSVLSMRGLVNVSWTYDIRNDQVGALTIQSEAPGSRPVAFDASGNLGIGTTAPGSALEVNGNVKLTSNSGASVTYSDGTVQTTAWNGVLFGGDYAESVNVSGDRNKYEPGDVLVIDPGSEGTFLRSSSPYSTTVTGIYSTKPGVVGRRQTTAREHMREEVPMAMTGIVPTKVTTENGPIKPGDLLVTSSRPGYAMRGTDRSRMLGAVIGKAIGRLDSGAGVIEAVVTLQ